MVEPAALPAQFVMMAGSFVLFSSTFVGALAATRILYEGLFPRALWLGRPLPVFGVAALAAFAVWLAWIRAPRIPAPTLLPLLLNLLVLSNPAVDLVNGRLIFAASLWLTGLLLARSAAPPRAWRWLGPLFILVALLPIYLLTMSADVGRDDTFEFQVVTPQLGIVHPTGYPLYLLLGKLFTLLPLGSAAWRLNVASTVYALAALALLFGVLYRLWKRPLPAILGAVAIGLTPTFWSQAIIAEVYALHALMVAAVLWGLGAGGWGLGDGSEGARERWVLVAGLIGLGLANHLTTVFLIPPALVLFLIDNWPLTLGNWQFRLRQLGKTLLAFALPLSLYVYLPLRWRAVVGEPMGFGRFVDWVVGGRFQGALQWGAWRSDPTRYQIVGQLFLDNWGWFNLALAAAGLIWLAAHHRRWAVVLLVTWLGYTFYCLNYYVPDLAVFLLPAQVVVGLCWASGVMGIWTWVIGTQRAAAEAPEKRLQKLWILLMPSRQDRIVWRSVLAMAFTLPLLWPAAATWAQVDQSGDDGRSRWARAVLNLPLAEDAAILADSDKYPPLYYVQQTEDVRADLDISVWPDEAAYRAQLAQRLAAGQTVYLARFLPGLEGSYHLRAVGPLVEVGVAPLTAPPRSPGDEPRQIGPLLLVDYELAVAAPTDPTQTAVTFYWQATEPITQVLHVYTRFSGAEASAGQHPANNFYPTVAWEAGEIVSDYHELPRPIVTGPTEFGLEVGLAPPFTPPQAVDWHTVELIFVPDATPPRDLPQPVRMVVGETAVTAADFPTQLRPQQPLPLLLSGSGDPTSLNIQLNHGPSLTIHHSPFTIYHSPFTFATEITTDVANGRYPLTVSHPDGAICGWLRPATTSCTLGAITVSGAPLPAGAVNFDDKLALLDVDAPTMTLTPGGALDVTLTWQALADLDENYTVFVQVLDAQDRIVGQVDSWPVQGTRPTSQWAPGETVSDPYRVQLDADLPPGQYRLQVGWYLLATLRRLPVLDESGAPVDDKVVRPGLVVP